MGAEPDPLAPLAAYSVEAGLQVESTRQRTQQTATLAGAFAAAVITAGALGVFSQRPTWVLGIAGVALALWLIAAALYLFSVAGLSGWERPAPLDSLADAQAYYKERIDHAHREREIATGRLRVAVTVTVIALMFTVAAIGVALLAGKQIERTDAMVTLTEPGRVAVNALCALDVPPTVGAQLVVDELSKPFVTLRMAAAVCERTETDVRVQRASVLVVRTTP
jgi:hypothetical protein